MVRADFLDASWRPLQLGTGWTLRSGAARWFAARGDRRCTVSIVKRYGWLPHALWLGFSLRVADLPTVSLRRSLFDARALFRVCVCVRSKRGSKGRAPRQASRAGSVNLWLFSFSILHRRSLCQLPCALLPAVATSAENPSTAPFGTRCNQTALVKIPSARREEDVHTPIPDPVLDRSLLLYECNAPDEWAAQPTRRC